MQCRERFNFIICCALEKVVNRIAIEVFSLMKSKIRRSRLVSDPKLFFSHNTRNTQAGYGENTAGVERTGKHSCFCFFVNSADGSLF